MPRRRHGLAGLAGHRRRGGGLGLLGAVVERLTIRPMLGESPISVFMVTVGLASILVGVVELVWTADQRRLPEFMPRSPVMVGEAFVAPKVFYGFGWRRR